LRSPRVALGYTEKTARIRSLSRAEETYFIRSPQLAIASRGARLYGEDRSHSLAEPR
jgi:hypothetical protein